MLTLTSRRKVEPDGFESRTGGKCTSSATLPTLILRNWSLQVSLSNEHLNKSCTKPIKILCYTTDVFVVSNPPLIARPMGGPKDIPEYSKQIFTDLRPSFLPSPVSRRKVMAQARGDIHKYRMLHIFEGQMAKFFPKTRKRYRGARRKASKDGDSR
jgi:hypothetical protein